MGSNQYGRSKAYDDFGHAANGNAPATQGGRPSIDELGEAPPRRPFVQTNPSRRLTITNGELTPEPEEISPPVKNTSPKKFLSAYEEKQLLQSRMGETSEGSGSSNNAPAPAPAPARAQQSQSQSQQQRNAWLSAEEEKRKLYESARHQAQRTQAGMGNYSSLSVSTNSSLNMANLLIID